MQLQKDTLMLSCENTSHKRATGIYKLWFHGYDDSNKLLKECLGSTGPAAILLGGGSEIAGKIVQVSADDLDWFVLFEPVS
jgi:hypothetical protein